MGVEVEVFASPTIFRPVPARGHITYYPELQAINRVLQAAGIEPYTGPQGGAHLCLRIGSYSTLSSLMYLAADLLFGPRGQQLHDDYILRGYAEHFPSDPCPPFQHLTMHSGCDGYYVPIDFPKVLDGGTSLTGRFLGSAVRLRAECEELADLHDFPLIRQPLPADLPPDISHEGIWNSLYHIGSPVFEWFERTDEWDMMTCAKLHYAACYAIHVNGLMLFS